MIMPGLMERTTASEPQHKPLPQLTLKPGRGIPLRQQHVATRVRLDEHHRASFSAFDDQRAEDSTRASGKD